jgi:8-oxo-dGTP pyrophosphatase MutT (NUDIX family)
MESCDVVDEFGVRTGRVVTRGTELAAGEFYPVVHVWIRDENGNFLIQQRALHLASGPGVWATTVGYVQAREDSLTAAIREVEEELGIRLSPAQFRRFRRQAMENRVEDIWLVEGLNDTLGALLLGIEVADCKWVSRMELEQMRVRGEFFRYSYLDDLLTEER